MLPDYFKVGEITLIAMNKSKIVQKLQEFFIFRNIFFPSTNPDMPTFIHMNELSCYIYTYVSVSRFPEHPVYA